MEGARYRINGRVQGVGFRYFVQTAARRLGLEGWVRNLPDGSVECAAAGKPEQLEKFETELRRGPAMSKVESVERSPYQGNPGPGFEITH